MRRSNNPSRYEALYNRLSEEYEEEHILRELNRGDILRGGSGRGRARGRSRGGTQNQPAEILSSDANKERRAARSYTAQSSEESAHRVLALRELKEGEAATQLTVCLYVNGFRIEQPTTVGALLREPLTFTLDVPAVEEAARRYNGLYELTCVFTFEGGPLPPVLDGRLWGETIVEGIESGLSRYLTSEGEESFIITGSISTEVRPHYLGPLLRDKEIPRSAMLVTSIPTEITVSFGVDLQVPRGEGAQRFIELLLAEHVRAIVEKDEYRGSVQSSHVQNRVIQFKFYTKGIERFVRWKPFVNYFRDYYKMWTTIKYTKEELEEAGFKCITEAGEPRIIPIARHGQHLRADLARDRIRFEAEEEFCNLVQDLHTQESHLQTPNVPQTTETVAATGDIATPAPCRDCRCVTKLSEKVLQDLSRSRSFQMINSVNYYKLVRYVVERKWAIALFDELHPIRLDLKAGVTSPQLTLVVENSATDNDPEGRTSGNARRQ